MNKRSPESTDDAVARCLFAQPAAAAGWLWREQRPQRRRFWRIINYSKTNNNKKFGGSKIWRRFSILLLQHIFCFITGCWNLLSKLKRHRFDWNWRQWKPERKMLLLDQDDTTAKNQKKICFTENFFSHLIIHNNFLHLNIFFFLVVVYNKTKMSASVM